MAAPFMSALCDEQKKKSTQTPLCGDVTEDADLILWLVDSSSRRRAYNRVTQVSAAETLSNVSSGQKMHISDVNDGHEDFNSSIQ
ncbi:hypothetical protein F2P81_022034 [Scophthalmus maximus]|uniref:Uncharacterized protein n=1 Tax=Scophthalmus maximus TaxID=52904 RepID=A0A6A4RT17_SCOMX|nr:hypothetical protein F2P81_022034 [Scophthalmus maximus]